MLPFIPFGKHVYSALAQYETALKLTLGLTIMFAGARGAWYGFARKAEPPPLGRAVQLAALFAGALVQGMFNAGGPLIVLYANERLTDKGSFRATMSALWFTLNTLGLILRLILTDMYAARTFLTFAKCLPLLAAGILAGMLLHRRVDNAHFRKIVYLIMLAGGLVSSAYCLAGLFG